jgi:1-acyl-sn-glycerol-3-phosphate acyltransferase
MTDNPVVSPSAPALLPPNPVADDVHLKPFSRIVYRTCKSIGQAIWFLSFRTGVINAKVLQTPGGYQIACTHLSHLEPFLLGIFHPRTVDWITRIEFYRHGVSVWFLRRFGCIPIRRQGVAASAVRTAIDRLKQDRVVAIAPEGGVAIGPNSVCRGGRIKRGVCLIAARSGKPVIPCVILGTHKLQSVGPYLPFRRGRIYLAFGEPIHPPMNSQASPRENREAMAAQLEAAFVALYQRLLEQFELDDHSIP